MFNKVMDQIKKGGLNLSSGFRIGEPLLLPDKMSFNSSTSAANFQVEVLNFVHLVVSFKVKLGERRSQFRYLE